MNTEEKTYYNEFRCTDCNKLMFKGLLVDSEVEVKCKRCNTVNVYQGRAASAFHCPMAPDCAHNPKNQ